MCGIVGIDYQSMDFLHHTYDLKKNISDFVFDKNLQQEIFLFFICYKFIPYYLTSQSSDLKRSNSKIILFVRYKGETHFEDYH